MLSARIAGRTREGEVGAGDCASVAEHFAPCSVLECNDVHCFGNVLAVAEDDWVAVEEHALSVTEGEAEKTAVKKGLE